MTRIGLPGEVLPRHVWLGCQRALSLAGEESRANIAGSLWPACLAFRRPRVCCLAGLQVLGVEHPDGPIRIGD